MARRCVYVVDDEEPIRRSVSLLLKANGFTAEAFAGGQEFLDVASWVETGCVLLDLRMPDLDRIAVQRSLIASGASHPTIVMTGHGDLASAVAALEALPAEQREIIVGRLWGGMTLEQLAGVAGCSVSTAHRRFESGIQALRERLGVACPK